MGISRHNRERWRDRDLLAEIKQQDRDFINQVLYLREIAPQKQSNDKQNKERIPNG